MTLKGSILDQALKQWPAVRKRGDGNTKIQISRAWKKLAR